MKKTKPDIVKVSFNIAEPYHKAIEDFAASHGLTMAEVMRRAISMEMFLQGEAAKGRHIIIEDEDGSNRKEIVMGIPLGCPKGSS